MFYASNENTTIMICVEKYYIPLPKIKLKKKKNKTTGHSYKTSRVVGSFNYWCFSSLFFLSFLAKHAFRWISKQMKHSLVNGLPWCSSSSTFIIFPLLFFGKLFNQFTLLWGQIPAQIIHQIKHFNLLWKWQRKLVKWEAAKTFPYDAIDFTQMTLFSPCNPPSVELDHKNICWKVKNTTTTMAKNEKTYAGMLTLKCTYWSPNE